MNEEEKVELDQEESINFENQQIVEEVETKEINNEVPIDDKPENKNNNKKKNKKKIIITIIIVIIILIISCFSIFIIGKSVDKDNKNSSKATTSPSSDKTSILEKTTTSNPFSYVDVKQTEEEQLLNNVYLTHPYYGENVKDAYTGTTLTAEEIDTRWIINYVIWNVKGIVKDYKSELEKTDEFKDRNNIDSPGIYKISDIESKIYDFFGLNIKLYEFSFGCEDEETGTCGGALKFDSTNTYCYELAGYGLGSYVTKVSKLVSTEKTDNGLTLYEQAVFYDEKNTKSQSDGSYLYEFYDTSTKKNKVGDITCPKGVHCYFRWDNISPYIDSSKVLTFEHTFKLVDGIYVWQGTTVK